MNTKATERRLAPATLIEASETFARRADTLERSGPNPERFDVVVIGAGQAGLSVGHHLAKRGLSFVILDGGRRVGDSWRRRWDSLRLFTPARYDGLEGLPFPGDPDCFPTKDEMADYLERYAHEFGLPVRLGTRVRRLSKSGGDYVIDTSAGRRARARMLSHGGPLIRVRKVELEQARVERVPRVVGVRDGLPMLETGSTVDVESIVWCTG